MGDDVGRYILEHSDHGLSQDLEAGCLKLAIIKLLGVQIFKGDHTILTCPEGCSLRVWVSKKTPISPAGQDHDSHHVLCMLLGKMREDMLVKTVVEV